MIKCNLAVLMAERELKMADVIKATGIAKTTIRSLYYNDSKGVQFETLNTLCEYLGVSPGDLVIYYPFDYKIEKINKNDEGLEIRCTLKIKNHTITSKINALVGFFTQRENTDDFLMSDIVIYINYPSQIYEEIKKIPKIFTRDLEEKITKEVIKKYKITEDKRISVLSGSYEEE